MRAEHINPLTGENEVEAAAGGGTPVRRGSRDVDPSDPATWSRTPRNALCPCGSGKKYKHCHGQL